ncbi:MAG: AAA family ATPase [Elusimicrobia bacterium]|nr:AAA family ATPase [Elusimicrobiota bacterium]
MMKIISIANQKGGCGKTTTAINLVSSLGANGQKVLLIDLDPQAHATLGLNCDDQNSIYNVISNITPRKLSIRDIIQTVNEHFDIVPSNVLVGTLEQELADEIGREMKLLEVLSGLKEAYDYVIIDCPPSLGFLTVNALRASHEVIIPVETSRFSVQGVDHLMDIINLIRDRLDHPVEPKVLITMFDSRLRHSFSMMSKIKDKFGGMLLDTIIHVNVKLKEAAVSGKTVLAYDKYCRGAKDYGQLAKELLMRANGKRPEFSLKMRETISQKMEEIAQARFAVQAPAAQSVYVAGNFNDWSISEDFRLKREGDVWNLSVPLKAGAYEYQFIIDGRWQPDPANPRKVQNGLGDMNSLLEVAHG